MLQINWTQTFISSTISTNDQEQYPNFNPNIESSCSSNSATSPCLNVSGHLNDIEISNDIPLLATEIVPINVKDKSNKRKVCGKKKKKIDAALQ